MCRVSVSRGDGSREWRCLPRAARIPPPGLPVSPSLHANADAQHCVVGERIAGTRVLRPDQQPVHVRGRRRPQPGLDRFNSGGIEKDKANRRRIVCRSGTVLIRRFGKFPGGRRRRVPPPESRRPSESILCSGQVSVSLGLAVNSEAACHISAAQSRPGAESCHRDPTPCQVSLLHNSQDWHSVRCRTIRHAIGRRESAASVEAGGAEHGLQQAVRIVPQQAGIEEPREENGARARLGADGGGRAAGTPPPRGPDRQDLRFHCDGGAEDREHAPQGPGEAQWHSLNEFFPFT